MYKEMFKFLRLSDFFSLIGLVFALIAIFCILKNDLVLAVVFMYISAIADILDGIIGRKIKRDNNFGSVLDSLCDVVLYLISVVLFGYFIGLQDAKAIIAFVIFIVTGIMRLARFTITGPVNKCYVGLPVGYSLSIPVIYFALIHFKINIEYLLILYFVPSFLMISSIKVKKYFM